ncbi:multifunctional CCA addition/repair protein [Parendozoicomonas haliclonae]|uniref:CCA-adding enzyme n=1 Tax=Parendozoicomonas haliclonae TaxID=1960125 RepID=A0A1X7AE34_9GAMM|nr:multifunctional CCA addition/repair protein [Parendozoicomonas haliclonae]SMA31743.1 Multifunctional CCA protein [Parendozoicomonas haliclonae]
MKTYLVGGAVRDKLLGLPVKDRDWMVTGATPEDMTRKGFRPVGQDFPVFLHPKSNEEYALARTERKSGHGYSGFVFHTSPDISVEDDLLRRDLTINAIAEDEQGQLIDPYQGQQDLQQRILRHVSPAFREDPLRILRVARFAARFYELGFTVAEETLSLMQEMVSEGEADWLVAERVWQETTRALDSKNPEIYFQVLYQVGALQVVMPEVCALYKSTPSLNSSALQVAAIESKDTVVRFACATVAETPEQKLAKLCQRMKIPVQFKGVAIICEKVLSFWGQDTLTAEESLTLLQQTDGFRRPERFEQILDACEILAQAAGHNHSWKEYLNKSLAACKALNVQDFLQQGLKGKELADALNNARIEAIRQL